MEGKEFDSFIIISFKTFLDQYSKENNTALLTAGLPNIQIKDCLKIQNHFQQSLNIHMQSMFGNISESKRRVRAIIFSCPDMNFGFPGQPDKGFVEPC